MKKVLTILIAAMAVFTTSAGAISVGDKISEAVYSDLAVYINHYPIPSYVVNDYAVIVAEDLSNYCCDVVWDGNARTLHITESADKDAFTAPAVYKSTMPGGSRYADVLYTDIQTFVNGTEVTSFNINGRTMIVVDEFGAAMGGYTWDNSTRAAKAWIDGKPFCEFAPLTDRAYAIHRIEHGHDPDFINPYATWHDFDFDGINEPVNIAVVSENPEEPWIEQYMDVTIGDRTRRVETIDALIDAVYVCDIDTTDGVKDLAVVTIEISGDPRMRLYRYDEALSLYKFGHYEPWKNDYVVEAHLPLGYIETPYLNVNDDGSLTVKTQTYSSGMWYVNRNYAQDDYGTFMEVRQDRYAVLPDFMADRWMQDQSLDSDEEEMWKKGYIKAHVKYTSNGFTIQKGEYFKVVYDNDDSFIYVVKENGEAGWISIDYNIENRYELNNHFFYLAG